MAEPSKTLRVAFETAETGFDPQAINDNYSFMVCNSIFDSRVRSTSLSIFEHEPAGLDDVLANARREDHPRSEPRLLQRIVSDAGRAIALGYDRATNIKTLRNGQDAPAVQPPPPGITGYDPAIPAVDESDPLLRYQWKFYDVAPH